MPNLLASYRVGSTKDSDDETLEFRTCELCLECPTNNATKRRKNKGEKWRVSGSTVNFIAHLAAHEQMQPGFACKVQVFDEERERYARCGACCSTQHNLAKHLYAAHYKLRDTKRRFTVLAKRCMVRRPKSESEKRYPRPSKKRKRSAKTTRAEPFHTLAQQTQFVNTMLRCGKYLLFRDVLEEMQ